MPIPTARDRPHWPQTTTNPRTSTKPRQPPTEEPDGPRREASIGRDAAELVFDETVHLLGNHKRPATRQAKLAIRNTNRPGDVAVLRIEHEVLPMPAYLRSQMAHATDGIPSFQTRECHVDCTPPGPAFSEGFHRDLA